MALADRGGQAETSNPTRISLTTSTALSPRAGPNYLLYVSVTGTSESISKLTNGAARELWNGPGAHVLGGATRRRLDCRLCAARRTLVLVRNALADGTGTRRVVDSLDLLSAPAWAPDSHSITVAANSQGTSCLFRVPLDGSNSTRLVKEYSLDPASAPAGSFVVYSGPDIGTTFSVKAATTEGTEHPLPALTLTRGARDLRFASRNALVVLRGEIQHRIYGLSICRPARNGS